MTESVDSLEVAKIFCIEMNKTGTTSLGRFFEQLGFKLGDQIAGELLIHKWAVRNFGPIIDFVSSAQVFQDIPFSLPFTFIALDSAFPGSKFILTIRDNAEQWYRSLTRFHGNIIGKGRLPTADDLKECSHRYRGWLFEAMQLGYGISEQSPYEKSHLIEQYEGHNRTVIEYFQHRPGSLLIINLSNPASAQTIMSFVSMAYTGEMMPHLNRTD